MNNIIQNKNVGIITFHRAINYGAILQVYALQETIKKLGGTCTVLDYRNEILENRHRKKYLFESKSIKEYIKYFLLYKNYNKKFDKFRSFSDEYLNLSRVYNNFEELQEDSEFYDKFVCGSDQVWNFSITNFDPAYFLDFTSDIEKKNSYAASFGINSIPEEHREKYSKLLGNYKYMSIREKQGAELVKQLTNNDAEIVLDPTLLVSKNEWFKISQNNIITDKYILVYAFGGSQYIMNLAEKLSKKTGYKIVVISNSYKKSSNINYVKAAGPKDFLGLFKNAEYIITNSFHGTAFSINFNKQFFTELLPEGLGVNSRLEDILDLFDLRDRQILNDDLNIVDTPIDFNRVNEILKLERQKSIDFLKLIVEQ